MTGSCDLCEYLAHFVFGASVEDRVVVVVHLRNQLVVKVDIGVILKVNGLASFERMLLQLAQDAFSYKLFD